MHVQKVCSTALDVPRSLVSQCQYDKAMGKDQMRENRLRFEAVSELILWWVEWELVIHL